MNETHYNLLAELIHRHRTWIDILLFKSDITLMARSGASLMPVRRKVMTLIALRPCSVYPKGHVWNIPEDRLDRAVRALKRDPRFASRWKNGTLTCKDAEAIIHRATNSFLTLHLSDLE